MPVQPLHGARRRDLPSGTRHPSEDLLSTVHAAAQAVWDIRRVISWVRHTDPGVSIGITGISLGGYATSLVASIEDGLACAIVGVPAVDLPHLIERHPGLHRTGKHQALLTLAQELTPVVSPLALTPRVPPEGRFIFAGLADQLAHPRRQVVRLWEHWDRPAIAWYPVAHIGFLRAKPVWAFVPEALLRSGLVVTHR